MIGPVTLLEGAELLDDPIIHQRRKGWAVFSPDERYRYALGRPLYAEAPARGPHSVCAFLMCNPSVADADQDDPTVARCIGYATRWGFGGLIVANAFAWRSTDPKQLRAAGVEPVGRDNDAVLAAVARAADLVVCAWGVHGKLRDRGKAVRQIIETVGAKPHALKLTKDGYPVHPLYQRNELEAMSWG